MADARAVSASTRPTASPVHRFAIFPPAVQEPEIVLQWIVRLRWLALAGQAIATIAAVTILRLHLPLAPIIAIVAITGLSNVGLQMWTHRHVPTWLIPAVLVLDVFLLTALLLFAGGSSNPFRALYLVHIAMAVVTLAEGWSWLVVAVTAACYGLLVIWPLPQSRELVLGAAAARVDWVALALVAVVIAYFVGRMMRSLRRHERDLVDARELAARNEQLAALATLAAGAAHELNTPLSTIAVVAKELEVLAQQLALRESIAQDARLIRKEVDRCQFILGRMRVDVMQGEWQKRSSMQTTDLVAGLREDLKGIAGDSLRIECATDLQQVSIPVRAVQQAVSILVDNAIDASPGGKPVKLCIYGRNGHIVFEVQDQGEGMSQDVIRRAGEPFFTTKPPGQGMGLGLFLARLVAQRLGGSLKLESVPGEGTRAMLELPKA